MFHLFAVAEFCRKVIKIVTDKSDESFCAEKHRENPQADDFVLYISSIIFYIDSFLPLFCDYLHGLFLDVVEVRNFHFCRIFEYVNCILSVISGCRSKLINDC